MQKADTQIGTVLNEPFMARCQKAAQVATRLGVDQLIASDPSTVRWLTGRSQDIEYGPLYPFSAGTLVVLDQDGSGAIVCPAGEANGGPEIPGLVVRPYEAYSVERLDPFQNASPPFGGVRGSIAIEAHACPAIFSRDGKWVDAGQALRSLRIIKDEAELLILRHAAGIVNAGQRAFRQVVKPGLAEIEVFSQVHAAMEQAAGQRVPVLVDLISGERIIEAGLPPTDRVIQKNDLVLCDLLIRVNGYWADSCTTISMGRADQVAQDLHDACRQALDIGIRAAEPGMTAGHLDRLIRQKMAGAGYSYPHHSGHGLGVSFHEEPRIVPGASICLEPGMVLALEPGGFNRAIGARVEHMLEITDTGARVLTEYDLSLNKEALHA